MHDIFEPNYGVFRKRLLVLIISVVSFTQTGTLAAVLITAPGAHDRGSPLRRSAAVPEPRWRCNLIAFARRRPARHCRGRAVCGLRFRECRRDRRAAHHPFTAPKKQRPAQLGAVYGACLLDPHAVLLTSTAPAADLGRRRSHCESDRGCLPACATSPTSGCLARIRIQFFLHRWRHSVVTIAWVRVFRGPMTCWRIDTRIWSGRQVAIVHTHCSDVAVRCPATLPGTAERPSAQPCRRNCRA